MEATGNARPWRALILAGGGLKVAFQAGVLQVWLDEYGLKFDLADGCSGGCLNLAMYCQGMSGTDIADNWRRYIPLKAIDFNWREYYKLIYAESVFEFDRFRKNILPAWKLDFSKINMSTCEATFNAYNFSKHELAVWGPSEMDEDRLIASISLPLWFPPVEIDGDTHIDAVFVTDANIEEALRRGADELWIIWTVSELDEWHDGLVNHYFQMVETSANGEVGRVFERIEESNKRYAQNGGGEFGRHIEVKLLKSEVQMHYLMNFSNDQVHEAVNAGVKAARAWCAEMGLKPKHSPSNISSRPDATTLRFSETMKGYITFGEKEFVPGYLQGRRQGYYLTAYLTVDINDFDHFVTDPDHQAHLSGHLSSPRLGKQIPVTKGTFNLLVDKGDPRKKLMLYRLFFSADGGKLFTLSGAKLIIDDEHSGMWRDTTTLFVRLYHGHVYDDLCAEPEAAGIIKLAFTDFLKQLTTFRAKGPATGDGVRALARFGGLFVRKLQDVYARAILS